MSSMPSVAGAADEERRIDEDGNAYTKGEFFLYYGNNDAWNAAPLQTTNENNSAASFAFRAPTQPAAASAKKTSTLPSVSSASAQNNGRPTPKLFVKGASVRSFDIVIEGDNGEAITSTAAKAVNGQAGAAEAQGSEVAGKDGHSHHHHQHHHRHHHHQQQHHHHHHNPHHRRTSSRSKSKRGEKEEIVPPVDLSGPERAAAPKATAAAPTSPGHADDHADARRAFNKFDVDNDGSLDQEEVGKALAELGIRMSERELAIIFAEYDVDGNGTLDLPEFTLMMGRSRCHADSKDSLRQAFAKCDTDGSGTLEIGELRQIMHEFGVEMDDEELDEIFKEADVDGSGAICYDEFVEIMGTGE